MYGDFPALISEWMDNGTVLKYMVVHPGVSILYMVTVRSNPLRAPLTIPKSKGIASGLQFLHEQGVVHSDLKSVSTELNRLDFG